MTTLAIQPLYTGASLSQSFNLSLKTRYHIESIAPYLYIHNAPSGTFTLSLYDSIDALIYSKTFTSTAIKTSLNTASNYAHVFYPLITNGALKIEAGEYRAMLSASGYAYAPSSFLAWVQQHEDLTSELDYVPSDDSRNPLSLRVKVYKRGIN